MATTATSAMVQIRVLLPAAASAAAETANLALLAASLRAGITGLASRLGLPLDAKAVIGQGAEMDAGLGLPSEGPVLVPRIEVDGHPVVPPPGTLLRAAYGLPPSPARDAILRYAIEANSLAAADQAVAQALSSQNTGELELALQLIAVDLVLATFRRRPSLLVTAQTAQGWLSAVDLQDSWPRSWDPCQFLRTLLEAGLSARLDSGDRATITAAAFGSSPEESVQWLVSRAVSQPSLVLRLHPGVLAELIGGPVNPDTRLSSDDARLTNVFEAWSAIAAAISATTAVLVPVLHLAVAADLAPGTIQVSVLARALEPIPVPRTELDRRVLEQLPIFSGPIRVLGPVGIPEPAPELAASDADAEAAQVAYREAATDGSVPRDIWLSSLLARIAMAEVMSAVHLLLDTEQVAYRISQLEDDDPELINAVLDRLSLIQVTRLLRCLVAEGLYPIDLLRVFEVIAEADWLPVRKPALRALDPRPLVAADGRHATSLHRTLESLRRYMVGQLRGVRAARSDGVGGYLTDAATEVLEAAWLAGAQQADDDDLMRLAWHAEASGRPVVVTSDLARPLAARLLTVRESAVSVLSEAEATAADLWRESSDPLGR
ncbi:MAG: hypothetical protein ACLPKE_22395 [Streptosporangiaceae bacterium]